MNSPFQTHLDAEDIQDLRDILHLLALASAIIASPGTPVLFARVTAVMMQHTAMAWADLLATVEEISVVEGGAQ